MKTEGAYHLNIAVSDGPRSKEFYRKLLVEQVGWKTVYEDNEAGGYSDGDFTLWIIPADKKTAHIFRGVGFHHFAVKVDSPEKVDQLHQWCVKQEIQIVDAPSAYPKYSEQYCSFFFLDPDGMKLEIAFNPVFG